MGGHPLSGASPYFLAASSTFILSSAKIISVFGNIARASATTESILDKTSAEPCVNTNLLILNFCRNLNRLAGGK